MLKKVKSWVTDKAGEYIYVSKLVVYAVSFYAIAITLKLIECM
jgi:hypothetical protein